MFSVLKGKGDSHSLLVVNYHFGIRLIVVPAGTRAPGASPRLEPGLAPWPPLTSRMQWQREGPTAPAFALLEEAPVERSRGLQPPAPAELPPMAPSARHVCEVIFVVPVPLGTPHTAELSGQPQNRGQSQLLCSGTKSGNLICSHRSTKQP